MTVLVLGATGWLGSHYVSYFSGRVSTYGCSHEECDITNGHQVRSILDKVQPMIVINCAGKTHSATIPNIDGCIESLEARNETGMVNVVGAANVAQMCSERSVKLVHIGSGCIFDGYDQIFTEDSEPNPPSYYAQTKLEGDQAVLARNSEALILRIRMPISGVPHPRNLITKLAGAKQVVDVQNTVTVVEDLMRFTEANLDQKGVIHAVQPEPLVFRDLMQWYRELVDLSWNAEFIPREQYRTQDGRSNAIVISKRLWMQPTRPTVRAALSMYGRLNQK